MACRGTKWHRSTPRDFLAAPSTSRSKFPPTKSAPSPAPVNTLLKSSYLLGTTFEIEAIFNSLFDIAGEIAGAEACGLLSCGENDPASWEIRLSRRIEVNKATPDLLSLLIAPGAIASNFDKGRLHGPRLGSLVRAHLQGMVFPFPDRVPPAS